MSRSGIVGVDEKGAALRPFDQATRVVHPGIVAAQLPSSNQHQAVCEAAVSLQDEMLAGLAKEIGWGEIGLVVDGCDATREPAWLERTEVETVGRLTKPGESQPVWADA